MLQDIHIVTQDLMFHCDVWVYSISGNGDLVFRKYWFKTLHNFSSLSHADTFSL